MGLFKPKWQHKDPMVRTNAVEKMNPDKNQELLAKLARNDQSSWVRGAAIRKLDPKTNQELLAESILKENSIELKSYILKKLNPKRWKDLIARVSREIGDKLCSSCGVVLIKRKQDIPKIVHLVKEGLTEGFKTVSLAKKEAENAINAYAYRCSTCGTLVCKKCSGRKRCPNCKKKNFVLGLV
jgi:hypothetical protein